MDASRKQLVIQVGVIAVSVPCILVAVVTALDSSASQSTRVPTASYGPPQKPASPASFICSHCGKSHDGLPTDFGFTLPDEIFAMSKEERDAKAEWNTDICQMGERRFIRGVLRIRFLDRQGDFGWGVWVEVKRPVFDRYVELYDHDASTEPPYTATLANQPPGYGAALGMNVKLQFGAKSQRPTVDFPPDSKCLLATEQEQGMTEARYHEILKALGTTEH